jgi:cytidine deaminase
MTDRELFDLACGALKNAYAPYSHYRVGACLLAEDGRVFTGCNVENASFGGTICAERTAVVKAVSEGARAFTAIAVVGEKDDAWPCGICRQVLNEFSKDMRVICGACDTGRFTALPLSELLPRSFGPEDLK